MSDQTSGHISGVLHVGISIYHMEQSLAWYQENLGFRLVKDDGFIPPLGSRICFLEKDGFQIELFEYESPKHLPEDRLLPNSDLQTVGTKHIAFGVDDMEALKARLLSNQVEIAHETMMGAEHILFIRDCNGVLIELIQK